MQAEKRYNDFSSFIRRKFNGRVQKYPLMQALLAQIKMERKELVGAPIAITTLLTRIIVSQ